MSARNGPSGDSGSHARDRRAGAVDHDRHVYARRRHRQSRRRAEQERAAFDPSPPTEDDWVVGDEDHDAVRRIGPPTPVSHALEAFVHARGWSERLRGADLWTRWSQIAGADLVEHCEPVRLAGGVLVVRADSSVWATQLRYLSAQLRTNAEQVLGHGTVSQIRTVVGPLEGDREA